MQDRTPKRPGRVRLAPENGSAPFYATLERADEPTQTGDPLNKNTFLKDSTAALLGLPNTAVPDDALVAIKRIVDKKAAIAYGSYEGAGEYSTTADSENVTRISLGFQPDFLFVVKASRDISSTGLTVNTGNQSEHLYWIKGLVDDLIVNNSTSINATRHYSVDDDGMTMWLSGKGNALNAANQLNESGVTYHYLAGKGALEDQSGDQGGGGSAGENVSGGYYYPTVSQPTDDTLRMSFTPSSAGMPSVPDFIISLPAGPKGDPYTLTDEDKDEIVQAVLEALPAAEGVAY